MKEKLYLVTTNDKFGTTLGTFDTVDKVAAFLGTTKNTVYSKIKRARKNIPITTDLKVVEVNLQGGKNAGYYKLQG